MHAMTEIAVLFLAANLYAHRAHNVVKGPLFKPDHDMFDGLYKGYDASYDAVVEKILGQGETVDIVDLVQRAASAFAEQVKATGADATDGYVFCVRLMAFERGIVSQVAKALKAVTDEGLRNFLQGLADESGDRVYMLRGRTGK